jgi:enoyl-CoA hydratase/carnithine racemase
VSQAGSRVAVSVDGGVAHLRLCRPDKRNAIDEAMLGEIERFVATPPEARVAILSGEGDHFCAGLDLGEHVQRTRAEGFLNSRRWHRAFDGLQFGAYPAVSVLQGAVVGGGLELAASTHVRVAERSAFFALPEGQRGIFLGGGGAVRISRLIGAHRVAEMMLTGRRYSADEAERIGLVHYVVEDGRGLERGLELARAIASNSPQSNFAIVHALPRIAEMAPADGMFAESLTAAFVEGAEARDRMQAFLERKKPS